MLFEVQIHVNTDSIPGHSYIDMSSFFRRSHGKANLISSAYVKL